MHVSDRWFPVVAAAAIGVVGLSAPAIAAPSTATHPAVNIVKSSGQIVFSPTTVTAKATDPNHCTKTVYSFNIYNLTTSTQTLLYRGAPAFTPIPPNLHEGICGTPGKYTLGLKGHPKAILHIVLK